MSVKLAVTPDGRWDVELEQVVSSVRTAGFLGLGVLAAKADAAARSAYDAAGLACHEVLALVITDDPARTLGYAERLAGAAETMGARWVNTVFQAEVSGDTADVMGRVMPRQGTFDLECFAAAVSESGFDGYVSVEVLNE